MPPEDMTEFKKKHSVTPSLKLVTSLMSPSLISDKDLTATFLSLNRISIFLSFVFYSSAYFYEAKTIPQLKYQSKM